MSEETNSNNNSNSNINSADDSGQGTPAVNRSATRASQHKRPNNKLVLGACMLAVVLIGSGVAGLGLSGCGKKAESAAPAKTEAAVVTTTTTTTTTIAVGPTSALTGVQLNLDDTAGAALLARPVLVAKMDNSPEAMPQIGIEQADMVIELKVEGISRYMTVFQSKDVQQVGPIRSARTSDPDLLAMFGRPLVAWSGGNENVVQVMADTPWIQSVSHSQAPDAYSRSSAKKAPHNLILDVPKIYTYADQPPILPNKLFDYVAPGQDPGGTPVLGFDMKVGMSPLGFVWDPARGAWLRWSNSRRHLATDGVQIAPTNVVVLETPYAASAADSRSPEAQTLGFGNAWVFTQGRMTVGTWVRSARDQAWKLTSADGQPMLLTPGSTFVELPEAGTSPRVLDQATVDQLQAG
ncbi:MAG: DUF3048 domain-containing protein [Actinobacteria bacterium]|uniref:Unannotated protein n=1 Tax=freshwater metagenome TaxID=449393 RepID=A0A6J7U097_9ZZZZ|nr:DUF3048 domain-containing protein [Actinomycetota bacterium]